MYKCQYCNSENIVGKVGLKAQNYLLETRDANERIFGKDPAYFFCDICEDCGAVLKFYIEKPNKDFKVAGVRYNEQKK